MSRTQSGFRGASFAVGVVALAALCAAPARAAGANSKKPIKPAAQAAGPAAVSEDVGEIAVIVDNGLMVTPRNLFDLSFSTTLRFDPAAAGKFTVTRSSGVLDTSFGPELTFGYPAATLYPGDDDTQEVAFAAGFPFFGTTYSSVWVNVDGNVTFGAPEFASDNRDKAKHVLGPPRISAFLHDWNPKNSFTPTGHGSIHAVVKSNPARLVITWNGVSDWDNGGNPRDSTNTFQLVLFGTGAASVTIANVQFPDYGVIGIAQGGGQGPFQVVDYSTLPSPQTIQGGAIMEAFTTLTTMSDVQASREFFRSHGDKYDFIVMLTDFPVAGPPHVAGVRNDTHGIGVPLDSRNGQPRRDTVFDDTALWGSGGELEAAIFMSDVGLLPTNPDSIVNPPIEDYKPTANLMDAFEIFGGPVTLDGQTMSRIRIGGTLPEDDGEYSSLFPHGGAYSYGLADNLVILAQETLHRWAAALRFVHPTKGVGFDSYDLLGREIGHWSYFFNSATAPGKFPDAPRCSAMEGNAITDLGAISTYKGRAVALAAGERVFEVPVNALFDGYCALDEHLMGVRRADEVGPFFYVDDPTSIYTGQTLDGFDPSNPLNTSVTMRGWQPMGGIAFKGKRVDLTMKNIQDYEAMREGNANQKGKRFWGPKGNLKVRYLSSTGRVDPNGDASVTLDEAARELGDEADRIDSSGKPVDVKTMAFVLVVKSGTPLSHSTAIAQADVFRRVFQTYVNGPATGGRGKFDTSLNPAVH
jgi:hypothetical protein